MKAAILSVADPRALAATSIYTSYFEKNDIEYDVICANRYGKGGTFFLGNLFQYNFSFDATVSKLSKLKPFLHFKSYASRILESNNYDFIVVWNENTMLLFSDLLLRMDVPYTVNFRDFDFVRNPVFNFLRKKVCQRAVAVTSPSGNNPAFMQDYEPIQIVSLQPELPEGAIEKTRQHINPINISFIGTFQPKRIKSAKVFIDTFGNDERFYLRYIGTGTEPLREFVENTNYSNVGISGTFAMNEIGSILNQADIVNSYYGSFPFVEYLLMSIKMGYAIRAKIPLIVGREAVEVANTIEKYNIGFVLEDFDDLPDKIYEWYVSLDYPEYSKRCEEYIKDIDVINNELYRRLDAAFGLE